MIQAAIFDMDGTLLDSVDMHAEAWRLALREFGKFVPARNVRTQIGKGGDELLPVYLDRAEILSFGEALKKRRGEIWKKQFMHLVKPFPCVRDLFEALIGRGIEVAMASSAKKDELEAYMKLLKIDDLVAAYTSADDAEKSKPHPDIFEAAVSKVGVAPARAMAVGDTPWDAEAAGKAGVRTIGVLCGGFTRECLLAAGCVGIYKNPAALLGNMDGWVNLV